MSDSPLQARTLLVIDDQEPVRRSLVLLLRMSGYNAIGAESGPEAIALAATESIDGALIDVHMPMDGLETCRHLRAGARALGRDLRVWFMTGAVTRDLERRAVELGAFCIFAKPFECPKFLFRLGEGFSSPLPPAATGVRSVDDRADATAAS